MNDQGPASPFGNNIVFIPKSFEPDLNRAFGHSGILCDRPNATVESSGSPIGVDNQV